MMARYVVVFLKFHEPVIKGATGPNPPVYATEKHHILSSPVGIPEETLRNCVLSAPATVFDVEISPPTDFEI